MLLFVALINGHWYAETEMVNIPLQRSLSNPTLVHKWAFYYTFTDNVFLIRTCVRLGRFYCTTFCITNDICISLIEIRDF